MAGKKHLLCLSIDTDPDALSGAVVDRSASTWHALGAARSLPEVLDSEPKLREYFVPISWFVRADDQIGDIKGHACALLREYAAFWVDVGRLGHELGWHPHLYVTEAGVRPRIADAEEACEQLLRTWQVLVHEGFRPAAFRNGEGWHTSRSYATVESMGFTIDSTAIPGRVGTGGHPLDWRGTPNQPYFPGAHDVRCAGGARPMLEMPMNTWRVRAPYDAEPRLRYMNPAVHEAIFDATLREWSGAVESAAPVRVWVLVMHADDFWPGMGADQLYARNPGAVARNLGSLVDHLHAAGHSIEFTTVTRAAAQWRSTCGERQCS